MDPEQPFFPNFISCYFIALGVLLGGCLIGGIGAYLSGLTAFNDHYKVSQTA